jgi:Ca-activated chloride channel family protein
MIRSLEFQYGSPWAWVLSVAILLVGVALFKLEHRTKKPAAFAEKFREADAIRRSLLAINLFSIPAVIGGILACFWVIVFDNQPIFTNPVFLSGLVVLCLVVLLATGAIVIKKRSLPVFVVSAVGFIKSTKEGRPSALRYLVPVFRLLGLAGILLAMSRPQVAKTEADIFAEGMDMILTLDVSTSMRAVDFAPPSQKTKYKNRIDGAKEVISRFIQQRREDRLGLVVFAGDAFTQCPLTLDYSVIQSVLGSVKTGVIEDGTAIGNALLVSINRLRESDAKSKVIILLTDGDDNASKVAPIQVAEIAAEQDIRVFTILVGKGGSVPYPVGKSVFGRMQYQHVEIPTNPELLKQIAKISKGKFYQAVDQESLEKDFQDILDHMEKTRLMDPGRFTRHTEVFQLFLLPALLLILLELALTWTRFRKFP